jgi:hypothetical protein
MPVFSLLLRRCYAVSTSRNGTDAPRAVEIVSSGRDDAARTLAAGAMNPHH